MKEIMQMREGEVSETLPERPCAGKSKIFATRHEQSENAPGTEPAFRAGGVCREVPTSGKRRRTPGEEGR